jgi:hypothetical protein
MPMHETTTQYLDPSDAQKDAMSRCRDAAFEYLRIIENLMPDGPDKTYAIRKLREVAMWVNVGITRQPDGAPRS